MNNNGEELRKRREQIDRLDDELLRLLNRRAQVAGEVASVKKSSGLPVYDGQREQHILDRICELNQGPLDSRSLINIFRCIIRESRKLEESYMQRVTEAQLNHKGHEGAKATGYRLQVTGNMQTTNDADLAKG